MTILGIPQLMLPGAELIQTMTGSSVLIGTLLQAPLKLIMDNQGTVSTVLSISYDGGVSKIQWHTFPAGEAIILDGDLSTFPKGTEFYGLGASGNFSVSYTYLKQ